MRQAEGHIGAMEGGRRIKHALFALCIASALTCFVPPGAPPTRGHSAPLAGCYSAHAAVWPSRAQARGKNNRDGGRAPACRGERFPFWDGQLSFSLVPVLDDPDVLFLDTLPAASLSCVPCGVGDPEQYPRTTIRCWFKAS